MYESINFYFEGQLKASTGKIQKYKITSNKPYTTRFRKAQASLALHKIRPVIHFLVSNHSLKCFSN